MANLYRQLNAGSWDVLPASALFARLRKGHIRGANPFGKIKEYRKRRKSRDLRNGASQRAPLLMNAPRPTELHKGWKRRKDGDE